jgi:aldehyde oxidoreductase
MAPRNAASARRHAARPRSRCCDQKPARARDPDDGRARRRAVPLHRLSQDHRRRDGGASFGARHRPPPAGDAVGAPAAARRRAASFRARDLRRRRMAGRCAGRAGDPLAASSHAASFGDVDGLCQRAIPASSRVFTAPTSPAKLLRRDRPFRRPAGARGERARFRGEAVALVVGEADAMRDLDSRNFPVVWEPLPALTTMDEALAEGAALHHAARQHPDARPRRARRCRGGHRRARMSSSKARSRPASSSTPISSRRPASPAGSATASRSRPAPRRPIWTATTSPRSWASRRAGAHHPDRGRRRLRREARSVDAAVHRARRLALGSAGAHGLFAPRIDHDDDQAPSGAHQVAKIGAMRDGRLTRDGFRRRFQHRRLCLLGPTVANRVPVHASGPYRMPHYRALTRAVHTHLVPAGAFRGFGVPQSAIAQEQLFDELATSPRHRPLEFRILNALAGGRADRDRPGLRRRRRHQGLPRGAAPRWRGAREAERAQRRGARPASARRRRRRHVVRLRQHLAVEPSTMRLGLKPDGRFALHQGAVDIGQGSNTVIAQICADALGAPIDGSISVSADTDLTPDCGKTSASRQTFVSGKAAPSRASDAARDPASRQCRRGREAHFRDGARRSSRMPPAHGASSSLLAVNAAGFVLEVEETFDPPTTPLDAERAGRAATRSAAMPAR